MPSLPRRDFLSTVFASVLSLFGATRLSQLTYRNRTVSYQIVGASDTATKYGTTTRLTAKLLRLEM